MHKHRKIQLICFYGLVRENTREIALNRFEIAQGEKSESSFAQVSTSLFITFQFLFFCAFSLEFGKVIGWEGVG